MKKDTGTSFNSQERCRLIKKKFGKKKFSFEDFTENAVKSAIKDLPTGKANVSNDISVSIMTETIDAYCPELT